MQAQWSKIEDVDKWHNDYIAGRVGDPQPITDEDWILIVDKMKELGLNEVAEGGYSYTYEDQVDDLPRDREEFICGKTEKMYRWGDNLWAVLPYGSDIFLYLRRA